jgi:hypothetical protein
LHAPLSAESGKQEDAHANERANAAEKIGKKNYARLEAMRATTALGQLAVNTRCLFQAHAPRRSTFGPFSRGNQHTAQKDANAAE